MFLSEPRSRRSIPEEKQVSSSTAISVCSEECSKSAGQAVESEATIDLNILRNRGRQHVMDAVYMLPVEEKQAYLDALSKAPIICETESDPLIFLRRCEYNVEAAAKRLCLYWKERKDLFGSRALLPMTQTGNGALTREDALSLRAGWPAILPRSSSGLQVVVADRRQSHPRCSMENRLRCMFYVAYILSQEERAQVEGVIVLSLITSRTGLDPDFDEFQRRQVELVLRAFPCKPLHEFIVDDAYGTKKYNIQDALGVVIGYLIRHGSTDETVEVIPRREGNVLIRLKHLGLQPEGIPTSLGGTWTYTKFTAWCREQALREAEVEFMMASLEPHLEKVRTTVGNETRSSGKDAATKQRERNLIHSRRKRERRKLELDQIQEKQKWLEQEKLVLMADNKKLEELLAQAQGVVENIEE